MRAETPSWRTRMPTCRSPVAESLSQRRCITLCDSTAGTECTPDIYRVILLRTAASACQSNTPPRFLMPCGSELPSLCSAGRRLIVIIQVNSNRVFHAVHVLVHSWARASRLRPHREFGGGKFSNCTVCCLQRTRFSLSNALRTAHATAIAVSCLPPPSGWCWRWRSSARSKAEQDQPEY